MNPRRVQALLALQCYLTGQAAVAGSGTDEVCVFIFLPSCFAVEWNFPGIQNLELIIRMLIV